MFKWFLNFGTFNFFVMCWNLIPSNYLVISYYSNHIWEQSLCILFFHGDWSFGICVLLLLWTLLRWCKKNVAPLLYLLLLDYSFLYQFWNSVITFLLRVINFEVFRCIPVVKVWLFSASFSVFPVTFYRTRGR